MTDRFCSALLRTTVLQILQAAGFESSHMEPANVLTEIMWEYLQMLGSTTSAYAEFAGRSTGNLNDVVDALESLGIEPETMKEWLEDEGKALTPSWSEQSDPGRTLEGTVLLCSNIHTSY